MGEEEEEEEENDGITLQHQELNWVQMGAEEEEIEMCTTHRFSLGRSKQSGGRGGGKENWEWIDSSHSPSPLSSLGQQFLWPSGGE